MEPVFELDDYEHLARERLAKEVYDFVAGGGGSEWTLRENVLAFDRWAIRPRVLRGVTEADTETQILGASLAMPVMIAPWAYQGFVHRDAEPATARAAARMGTVMVVATPAEKRLEEIAAEAPEAPRWWQLYVFEDRAFTEEMLHRALGAGYRAIVFTVDLPVLGTRHRDRRNSLTMPDSVRPSRDRYDPKLTWDDLGWIREHAPLPVVVKGILTAEDARLSVEAGADGIVVSNHGGRQLDGVLASVEALPQVVDAVAGRIPVLLDGGIRRGTDVFKALALGAVAVLIGRPAAWGLAVDGEDGVYRVLEMLREELETAMVLAGCRALADIRPAMVARI
jgi:4-hydroxymandelate oxidase